MSQHLEHDRSDGVVKSAVTMSANERRSRAMVGNQNATTHGLNTMRAAVKHDPRTALTLAEKRFKNRWLREVLKQKGGREKLSRLEITEYELLADDLVIVRKATSEVHRMRRLSNTKTKTFYRLVHDWRELRSGFSDRLHRLGLQRVEASEGGIDRVMREHAERKATELEARVVELEEELAAERSRKFETTEESAKGEDAQQEQGSEAGEASDAVVPGPESQDEFPRADTALHRHEANHQEVNR